MFQKQCRAGLTPILVTMGCVCVLACVSAIAPTHVHAEENVSSKASDACTGFDWRMSPEITWINAGPKPIETGTLVEDGGDAAYLVTLGQHDDVKFALPPERERFPDGPHAGIIVFKDLPGPGMYQVSLTDKGWIDAISDGKYLKSVKSSNSKTCPPLRKSVRFDVAAGPLTIQISSVTKNEITMTLRKVEGGQ